VHTSMERSWISTLCGSNTDVKDVALAASFDDALQDRTYFSLIAICPSLPSTQKSNLGPILESPTNVVQFVCLSQITGSDIFPFNTQVTH